MRSKKDRWLLQQLRGLTFDDFLNGPGWGVITSRKDVPLETKFSENISLNIPFVSANMDTVTGSKMAVAVAKQGGIGIVHRYLSIEEEVQKIREVKREENFIIEQPYNISKGSTIGEARQIMQKENVGCLVVLDKEGHLLGLLGSRDIRFCSNDILVSERMKPVGSLISTDSKVTFSKAKKILDHHRLEKLPIIDKRGKLLGLITAKDIENLEKYPLANKDSKGQLVVGAAIGATGDYLERSAELIKAGSDVIVIDIANAQSIVGKKSVIAFRKRFPDAELVVGNIVLPEAVRVFQKLGANGLKIGLGPGSACTTRISTNVGVPQAQAIYDCARVAGIPIIADGGMKRHGHLALALLLGSSSCMIGGMFAGTDESPGHVWPDADGKKVKSFRGMASREAMYEKLVSESDNDPYETSSRISPEGMEKKVEYKGPVIPIIQEMVGHLASTISYLGAKSLKEAQEIFLKNPKKYLIKLSSASQVESWRR